MRNLGRISNTVHCKDSGPKRCAEQLPAFVTAHFGKPKIAFVGYQPAMIEQLSQFFDLRVVDLDQDNIGAQRFGLVIEGPEKTEDMLSWGDIILATGSTCVNGTIVSFLNKKPVVFYGVTVAGPAGLRIPAILPLLRIKDRKAGKIYRDVRRGFIDFWKINAVIQ